MFVRWLVLLRDTSVRVPPPPFLVPCNNKSPRGFPSVHPAPDRPFDIESLPGPFPVFSHLLATAGALLLTVHALAYGLQHAPLLERVFMGVYGLSAVFCFATSTVFHTFLCHSRVACERLSKLDYMGIALVLGGAFFPGIYYGFTCQPHLQLLYLSLITATVALIVAALRSPRFYAYEMFLWRLGIFSTLAAFGVIRKSLTD